MLDLATAHRVFGRYLEDKIPLNNIELDMVYSKTRRVWWCLVYRYDGRPLGKLYLDQKGNPAFSDQDIGRIVNEYKKY